MANRFWVGGAGTWDTTSTANWSATTGGASGASAPGVADVAVFDANSGNGYTVTLGANIEVQAVTANAAVNWTLNFVNFKITVNNNNTIVFRSNAVEYLGTPVVDLTYAGASGTRTITPGAATVTNPPRFNILAGTDTVTFTTGGTGRYGTVDFTGFSGTWTGIVGTGVISFFGNLTISSGMTITSVGTGAYTFAATSGVQQFTTAGKTIDSAVTQNNPGATLQLQDNLTMGSTRTFTLTAGTLDLSSGNRTLTAGIVSSINSNARSILFGTGKITVTGNAAGVWDFRTTTNFTYTGTSNVEFTYAGAVGTRIIRHGDTAGGSETNAISVKVTAGTDVVSFTSQAFIKDADFTGYSGAMTPTFNLYGNLIFSATQTISAGNTGITVAGTSGTQQITMNGLTYDRNMVVNGIGGTFAFQDAFTQGSTRTFTLTNGTLRLKNGVTSTVGSFVANNSSVKFLQSTTPGSQATLSQASGTVNVVDLTIRDINAVGGASWNAYTDFENTDAGNNDGWNFSLSPPYSVAELPITLRPFTQPRRF
jgi:hypothetical protein